MLLLFLSLGASLALEQHYPHQTRAAALSTLTFAGMPCFLYPHSQLLQCKRLVRTHKHTPAAVIWLLFLVAPQLALPCAAAARAAVVWVEGLAAGYRAAALPLAHPASSPTGDAGYVACRIAQHVGLRQAQA